MQPEPRQNINAALLGQQGGFKRAARLTAEQRSAISRHAARARWHRRQFNEEQAKAREVTYAVVQALKEKQLPLM